MFYSYQFIDPSSVGEEKKQPAAKDDFSSAISEISPKKESKRVRCNRTRHMQLSSRRQRIQEDEISLHSFLNRVQLSSRNAQHYSVITHTAEKLKFIIYFIFSILRLRSTYETSHAKDYQTYGTPPRTFFSDNDIFFMSEEILAYLTLYPLEPFKSLEFFYRFVLVERERYANQGYNQSMIRNLIKDYLSESADKQITINIKNYQYRLFKNVQGLGIDDAILQTISDFPMEDPIEILGFGVSQKINLL
jgi:hypothetical protein